jgi:hypothetical protein
MIIIWMLIGTVLVSSSFFIPSPTLEVWPALNAAGIAAVLYLAVMLVYILRNPIPRKQRLIIGVAAIVSVVALGTHWKGMQNTTHWQQGQLLEIHSVIVRGILLSQGPTMLLSVLEDYEAQGNKKNKPLSQIFLKKYPDAKIGANIYVAPFGADSSRLFVTMVTDTMIVLTGSHPYSHGRTAAFLPFRGRQGAIQERYILTQKGVRHESDN